VVVKYQGFSLETWWWYLSGQIVEKNEFIMGKVRILSQKMKTLTGDK